MGGPGCRERAGAPSLAPPLPGQGPVRQLAALCEGSAPDGGNCLYLGCTLIILTKNSEQVREMGSIYIRCQSARSLGLTSGGLAGRAPCRGGEYRAPELPSPCGGALLWLLVEALSVLHLHSQF